MPSPHRQLQKAIRIRQYQEGEPNNEVVGGVVFDIPYRDAVLADEPVFAYVIGNGNGTANQLLNQAYRTADPTNTATASSDVYEHPTLDGNNHTSNHKCLYFDCDASTGSPSVVIPYDSAHDVGTAFSFEALFKPNVDPWYLQLFASGDQILGGVNAGYYIEIDIFEIILGYRTANLSDITGVSFPTTLAANELYHLVVTVDNSSATGEVNCYLNGTLIGTDNLPSETVGNSGSDQRIIGAYNASTTGTDDGCFNGAIQAVCQYDKILTQADVTRHYEALDNNRFETTPAYYTTTAWVQNFIPPEGFWRFNGQETGASYVVGDDSGNGNTATRYNDVQAATTSLWHGGKGAMFLPKSTSDVAYCDTAISATLQHNSTSTLSATICPTKNAGAETWISNKIMSLGSMGTTSARQFGWRVDSSGYLELKYYINSSSNNTIQSTIPIPNFVADGSTTYEVAMTLDESANELKFYADGNQLGDTITFNDAIVGNVQSKVFIGTWGDDTEGQDGFYGFLDNVGYWQSILTPTEIRTMHSLAGDLNVLGGVLDNYVARWSFDPLVTTTTTPPTDYTAYYKFNNNTVGSAGGEPTIGGIPPTYEAAVFGEGARFNGTNQELGTTTTTLFERQTFSVSVWYKPDNALPAFVEEIVNCYVQRNDTTGIIYGWKLYHSSGATTGRGSYAFVAYDGTSTSSTAWSIVDGGLTANADGWVHLVATVEDGVSAKFYVNGKLVDIEVAPANIGYDSEVEFSVGKRWRGNSTAGFLEGMVDELKFYPDVLTEDEVAALYLDANIVENNQQDGYALQGQLVNAPTRVDGYDGVVNGAYSFNGTNQYIALLDDGNTNLEPTGAFTVTGWVKSNGTRVDILSNYDNSVRSSGFATSSRSFVVGQDSGGVEGTDYVVLIHNLADLTEDGNWHHIACEYTGTALRYYIDGVLVQTDATTVTPAYASLTEPRIGGTKAVTEAFADGELDDVRLYDSAIGEAQIYYLSKLKNPPLSLDESYYWKFDGNVTDTIRQTDWLVSGTPTYPTDGWNSNCISFDNTEYLYLDSTAFNRQTFSVSGFVRRRTETTTTQAIVMANYAEASNANLDKAGWFITADNGNGVMGAQVWDGNGVGRSITTPQGTSLVNKWMHVCLTVDEVEGYKFYVDGNLEATDESVITIGYDNAVGGVNTLYNFNFGSTPVYQSINDIDVDDLRFFRRAITAEEVQTLALRATLPTEAGVGPEAPLPPPSFPTLTLDIDVASITENTSNGSGVTYTSPTLTATAGGGSEQYEFTWTTDEPRLALILGANGFDQSATVNTNSFNILNGTSETVTGTITCTLTDLGDGNATVQDTVPVSVTFGFTDDYVAYWDYETDQITGLVVADQTASNHDATLQVNAEAADGADGLGLNFNGSQYGVVVDNADFKSASFSFSTWVKASGTAALQGIFQSGGANTGKAGWKLFRNASNGLKLELGNDSGAVYDTDWTDLSTANNIINSSEYKHVVVTYDGTTAKIYVNGTQAASKAWSGLAYPTTNYVVIGASHNGTSYQYPYVGDIDETKVYDRALSSVEVTELYGLARSPQSAPEPFSVLITNPASVIESVFPNGPISNTQDAAVTGGVGPFTYLWTKESGVANYDITAGSTSSTVTIGGTGFGENFYVFKVVVTDTGNGNVTVEDTTTHIINFGAV